MSKRRALQQKLIHKADKHRSVLTVKIDYNDEPPAVYTAFTLQVFL